MTHESRDLLDGQEGGHSTDRRELHIENEIVLRVNDSMCFKRQVRDDFCIGVLTPNECYCLTNDAAHRAGIERYKKQK